MSDMKLSGAPSSVAAMQQLAHLLSRAERGVTRELGRVLEDEGSTVEQWRALVLLADGLSHRMSELAESTLVPAPTLTRLVDRMVADNLAYRTVDVADRRRVLVHISTRGRALHRRLTVRIEENHAAIIGAADPEDVAQLAAILTDLAPRLR